MVDELINSINDITNNENNIEIEIKIMMKINLIQIMNNKTLYILNTFLKNIVLIRNKKDKFFVNLLLELNYGNNDVYSSIEDNNI